MEYLGGGSALDLVSNNSLIIPNAVYGVKSFCPAVLSWELSVSKPQFGVDQLFQPKETLPNSYPTGTSLLGASYRHHFTIQGGQIESCLDDSFVKPPLNFSLVVSVAVLLVPGNLYLF